MRDIKGALRFTYFIRVFGCQMNVADVNDLVMTLALRGGARVETEKDAGLIIVNTCVVRKKAEDKAISYIGMLRDVKKHNPQAFIAIIGCLVPKSRESVEKRFPFVDIWIDFSAPEVVIEALDNAFPPMMQDGAGYTSESVGFADCAARARDAGAVSAVARDAAGAPFEAGDATALGEVRRSGLVTIIRGCNCRCTYCIVPSVRGREVSVPAEVIVADAKRKAAMGFRMLTLLGQNVLAYGKDRSECPDFPALVEQVAAECDAPWLHFLTSHPRDLSDDAARRLYANARLLDSLHLPVQAGSNRVLELMNRGYTREYFISRIDAVRSARPNIFLSTDVIVGFPGETRAEFEESLDLLSHMRFNDAYMFKFSPREGTPAATMDGQVDEDEKRARLTELIALQHSISRDVNRKYVGQRFTALVEESAADHVTARLPVNKPVILAECSVPVGEFVEVEITDVRNSTFIGIAL